MFVDPHILCNPAIGDIDGDGHDELVVAVSYFFDREYYDDVVQLFFHFLWNSRRSSCVIGGAAHK